MRRNDKLGGQHKVPRLSTIVRLSKPWSESTKNKFFWFFLSRMQHFATSIVCDYVWQINSMRYEKDDCFVNRCPLIWLPAIIAKGANGKRGIGALRNSAYGPISESEWTDSSSRLTISFAYSNAANVRITASHLLVQASAWEWFSTELPGNLHGNAKGLGLWGFFQCWHQRICQGFGRPNFQAGQFRHLHQCQ